VKENNLDDQKREIEIMHHLVESPNVIFNKGFYEYLVVYVFMGSCERGELFDRIVQTMAKSTPLVKKFPIGCEHIV
jgi:hypothetical protein